MKKKIILSVLVILFVAAVSLGATMAWFTATAEIPQNEFTAGTVILEATDSWEQNPTLAVYNWNPGDCSPKEVIVEYKGTKNAYIRVLIEEEWTNLGDYDDTYLGTDSISTQQRDLANVIWKNNANPALLWPFDEWTKILDPVTNKWYWYYNEVIDGTYNPNNPSNPKSVTFIDVLTTVCLLGAETGNEYQGAQYTIDMTFESIQASHEAAFDEWGVGLVNGSWVEVEFDGVADRWETKTDSHYWNGVAWLAIEL